MKILLPGAEKQERIDKLLELKKIKSPKKIQAISDHLVLGHPLKMAAVRNRLDVSNFGKTIESIEKVALIVEELKEFDYKHLGS